MDYCLRESDILPYRKPKSVRFHNLCDVVLIPHRQEYLTLKPLLWYSSEDYQLFARTYQMETIFGQYLKTRSFP